MLTQQHHYLIERYVDAKDIVINEGFESEIDWQQTLDFNNNQEGDFLREAAWVILSSGMRERVIRNKFPAITNAFLGFKSAKEIINNWVQCRADAIKIFRHTGKIDAILNLASRIVHDGFEEIKRLTKEFGTSYLQSFDFIGPTTSYHLAKNIGLNVAKPDRHLVRVASVFGYSSVTEFCENISQITGDSVPVIDLVIWRFATIRTDYLSWFSTKTY